MTSERNILQRQLDAAKRELKSLKTCSLSWVRETSKVARVQETLATPRRRYELSLLLLTVHCMVGGLLSKDLVQEIISMATLNM